MNFLMLFLAAATAPEWMAGCWSGESGALRFEEQWTRPAGGGMMGMARTVKGDQVVFSEFMRIDRRDSGLALTVFTPGVGANQAPVEFRLKSQSDSEVVFENPAHDFPQRIRYRKTSDGMLGRIEGMDKGKERSVDFPMKRVACP